MKRRLIVNSIVLIVAIISFSQTTKSTNIYVDLAHAKLFYPNGKTCNLNDFKGKFVLINIWGQGCEPCVAAIPELVKLQEKYKNKLAIIAINDRIRIEQLPQFLKKQKMIYPVVIPPTDEDLMPIYYKLSGGKFYGFPLYTLVDKTGEVIKKNARYTEVELYLK